MPQLTTTEQRIMQALGDGMPVHPSQLMSCLSDEMCEVGVLRQHIYNINRKIKPAREIVSVYRYGRNYYQLFRSVNRDE